MGREEVIVSNPETFLEEEEDDDGPPPGFDSIAINSELEKMAVEDDGGEEDEDDGPPPGFAEPHPSEILPPPLPPLPPPTSHSDTQMLRNKGVSDVQIGRKQNEDRPPLDWNSTISKQPHPSMTSSELVSDIEKRNKVGNKEETELYLSSSERSSMPEHSSTPTPPLRSSSVASSDIETASKQQSLKNEDKKLCTEKGPVQQPLVTQLPPSTVPHSSEVGQLVCGTCRQLLSYPRGSKWVQCSACQTVNLALEAHEVGQVKCGGCTVLLMYPYGAPSVKCSSCHFTTRIGAQNRRPHLAAQQARRLHCSHQAC